MSSFYTAWNRGSAKWLWWIVIAGLLVSSPLMLLRWKSETSSKTVELVFDYRDLIQVSGYKSDPEAFLREQLQALRKVGIQSMAVYESTLDELEQSRRVQLYNATEYALLTGNARITEGNVTYVIFNSAEARRVLEPIVLETFREQLKSEIEPISYTTGSGLTLNGLMIGMPYEDAIMKPMMPDPLSMDAIRESGFHLVARLSNRSQPFAVETMDRVLAELKRRGVTTIIFDGLAVTGYDEKPTNNRVPDMAELMRKYRMNAAVIEPVNIKVPQLGFGQLAGLIQYDVIRLHSISEKDATLTSDKIADRLTLAVKDRNIRLLFLNTNAARDTDKGVMNDYLENITTALTGPDGAMERIRHAGYRFGIAKPFDYYQSPWLRVLSLPATVAGAAMIALLAGCFLPRLRLFVFGAGTLGLIALSLVAPTLTAQLTALGVGIAAASLSIIAAVRRLDRLRAASGSGRGGWGAAFTAFGLSLLISLAGAALIVELLSHIAYSLLLLQFRGVNLLALAPVLIAALYVAVFRGTSSFRAALDRLRGLLAAPVSVIWVLVAAVFGAAGWYYLSRLGNEGQASDYERLFRASLEEWMGVRPRTKEFLIAHPLFLAGAYLMLRYRQAVYLLIAGAIGQASIIGTFTHLHTPLAISAIRVGYGVLFGVVIAFLLVAVWTWAVKGWKTWIPRLDD